MVFCLYIHVKIKPESVDEFKSRWSTLAKHCLEHEPETLSYELCASDQAENEFMIVEVRPRAASSALLPPRLATRISHTLSHTHARAHARRTPDELSTVTYHVETFCRARLARSLSTTIFDS